MANALTDFTKKREFLICMDSDGCVMDTVRIKHSTIAHGFVKSIDKSAAEAIPGVVKVLTCFDVPEHCFPTAGHPWSMDPGHQDVADRHLLNLSLIHI